MLVNNTFRKVIDNLSKWSPWLVKPFAYRKGANESLDNVKILFSYNAMSLCFNLGALVAIIAVESFKYQPDKLQWLFSIAGFAGIFVILTKMVLIPELTITFITGWISYLFISIAWFIYMYYMLNIHLAHDTSQGEAKYRRIIYLSQLLTFFVTVVLDAVSPIILIITLGLMLFTIQNLDTDYGIDLTRLIDRNTMDYFARHQNEAFCALSTVSVISSFLQHFLYIFIRTSRIFTIPNLSLSLISSLFFGISFLVLYNYNYCYKHTAMLIFTLLLFCLNYLSEAFVFSGGHAIVCLTIDLSRTLYGRISAKHIKPYFSIKYLFLVNLVLAASEFAYKHLDVHSGFFIMNLLIKLLFWIFCTSEPAYFC
ncbi:hypothetical protein ENBRE01_1941 [Enteropsectra breve]|nr:hypothetical protein ENBRE01_1941 [Enteropsectra breve]